MLPPSSLLLSLCILITTSSSLVNADCPVGTTPEEKNFWVQVILTSDATFCPAWDQNRRSKLLAMLLEEALSNEEYYTNTKAHVCPADEYRRRRLNDDSLVMNAPLQLGAADDAKTIAVFNNQTEKRELLPDSRRMFVYKGAMRCTYCNLDDLDYRRDLRKCREKQTRFSSAGFRQTNWDGNPLSKIFHVPKNSTKTIIGFQVVAISDSAKLRSFKFYNKFFSHQIKMKDLWKNPREKLYAARNKEGVSWAYKVIFRSQRTGFIVIKVIVHIPKKLFSRTGRVAFKLSANKRGAGRVKVKEVYFLARKEFCKSTLEERLSKYVTTELQSQLGSDHCSSERKLRAHVYLYETDDASQVELQSCQ